MGLRNGPHGDFRSVFSPHYSNTGGNMRKDTVDRMKWASKLHGKARRRASKASKRADKDTFKHELGEL